MSYSFYNIREGAYNHRSITGRLLAAGIAVLFAVALTLSLTASAAPFTKAGCDFDDDGLDTWTLQSDCTSDEQINVPSNTTLDGGGHTITAGFAKTSNDNNAVIGVINADNVSVQNLTIDGSGGTELHGINTYRSTNVLVENVTIHDINRTGVVVNGSDVTVSNVTTANSGWHGFNVDQGSGVNEPSLLNVEGPVDQSNELFDIYVDNTEEDVDVVDALGQYTFEDNVGKPGDRLYTWLEVKPAVKEACFSNGWQNFQTDYKNQGQCVASVVASDNSKHKRD